MTNPTSIQQELTQNCTSKCRHCYNYFRTPDFKGSRINENKLLDIADRVIDADVLHVTLTGGEPLLVPIDTLDKLVSKYRFANIEVSVNSNLTLLNTQHIDLFKQYSVSVLTSMISADEKFFDDTTQIDGSYKRFLESMNLLRDNNFSASCNMVVSKGNLKDVYNTGKLAYELGARSFCATKVCMSTSGVIPNYDNTTLSNVDVQSMFDQLLKANKDFGLRVSTLNPVPPCALDNPEKYLSLLGMSCNAGGLSVIVSNDGDVKACAHLDFVYGNILDKPLKDIVVPVWKDEFLKNNSSCNSCAEVKSCGGSCRGDAYISSKELYACDPLMRQPLIKNIFVSKSLEDIDAIKINKGVRVRVDDESVLLFKSLNDIAFIDKFVYNIIVENYDKPITKEDFNEIPRDYVNRIFNNLVNKKIATKVEI